MIQYKLNDNQYSIIRMNAIIYLKENNIDYDTFIFQNISKYLKIRFNASLGDNRYHIKFNSDKDLTLFLLSL